jgi:hypothetical protein
MPLPCSACHHPERETLDKEIAHAVKSKTALAKEYGLSLSGLARHVVHSRQHAGMVQLAKGIRGSPGSPGGQFARSVHAGLAQMLSGATLAQEVSRLRVRADNICAQAEAQGENGAIKDPRTALLAIRELTRLLELQGRMLLEASQGRASDISAHPIWLTLSGLVMQAISGCDRCRPKVLAVIRERLGVVVPSEPSDLPFP